VNEGDANAYVSGVSKILNPNEDIKKFSEASIDNALSLSEMQMVANKYYDI
jgi:hypothetical protein